MSFRVARCTSRQIRHAIGRTAQAQRSSTFRSQAPWLVSNQCTRSYTVTLPSRLPGLMPDTENPEPPKTDDLEEQRVVAEIEEEDYHLHADEYLNNLYERAEQVMEQRDDVEVDYSAGVLTITMPPNGSYVINKQPPNKQIWLSSPISGPKRFDWSILGESMDQKEGHGSGEWIYLRDGTSLTDLLRKELGIDATVGNIEEQLAKKSTDPVE